VIKPLLILIAALLALGVIAVLIYLLVALLQMVGIGIVQWRDLISIDRWTEVFMTIGRNKLRTALTTISVAWGIFVLVFLLGLGNGLDNGLRKNFARDATNAVWMMAGKTGIAHGGYDLGRPIQFVNGDYDRAKKIEGIDAISGTHFIGGRGWGSMYTKRGNKANAFQIDAMHADAIKLENHDIVQGRFLSESDISEHRKSAVIGGVVRDFLFEPEENPIGQWIIVNNVPFQVVGVFTDPRGNEQERRVYIPISTAQLAFNGADRMGALSFTVASEDAEESKALVDKVVGQLAERHKFDPNDKQAVRVWNNLENFSRFQKMFFGISVFVIVIGLGTLAAGVVGVSNIMMISVKERTKEIGVRKALGATPYSIIFMVIQESVFLTSVAGLLGLAGGVGLCGLLGKLENDFIVNPGIDLSAGIAATIFLVVAGALAGYFPARAAARVNPVHTLRDQ
jgi:putative ABC transport system permease protein